MNVFKKIAVVLATVVAGIGGAVMVSSPAQATPTCPFDMICWFDRSDWQTDATHPKYVVNPSGLPAYTCFNMGVDPTGFNWNDAVDSVWWNDILYPTAYVEFYEGTNCTVSAITRAYAWSPVSDQMQSCTEPAAVWNGPCQNRLLQRRISSWAFTN